MEEAKIITLTKEQFDNLSKEIVSETLKENSSDMQAVGKGAEKRDPMFEIITAMLLTSSVAKAMALLKKKLFGEN